MWPQSPRLTLLDAHTYAHSPLGDSFTDWRPRETERKWGMLLILAASRSCISDKPHCLPPPPISASVTHYFLSSAHWALNDLSIFCWRHLHCSLAASLCFRASCSGSISKLIFESFLFIYLFWRQVLSYIALAVLDPPM